MKLQEPWYVNWFDTPYYHILYRHRDHAEAEEFITELTRHLALPNDARVLDLACGKGRHSNVLARLGYRVTGVDLSRESISHARQFAVEGTEFRVHNILDPIDYGPFEAVFNLFTSFGYFDDDALHLRVLQNVSACLQPGGIFVLDYLNTGFVMNTLIPHSSKKVDDITFDISRQIAGGFVEKHIRFEHKGQSFHFVEKVRLFEHAQLLGMMSDAGLTPVNTFGSYQLEEFKPHSPRMIIICKKT